MNAVVDDVEETAIIRRRSRRHIGGWPNVIGRLPRPALIIGVGILVGLSLLQLYARSSHSGAAPHSRFVELFFSDPDGLPTAAVPGQRVHFFFSINNNTSGSLAYSWVVAARSSGGVTLLGSHESGDLAAGSERRFAASVEMPRGDGLSRVSVQLAQPSQVISFLLR